MNGQSRQMWSGGVPSSSPNPRAVDLPAAAIVAAASSKSAAAAQQPQANGKPKLPVPAPAPAPITLVSNVSATFKAAAYENGLITACNNLTYDEVMRRRLVGLPRAQGDLVMKLKHKASAIFLLNLESKELFGVFEAEGAPGMDIEPDAWSGQAASAYKSRSSRFPAQCKFTIAADFETPIPERHYRDIFARNPQQKIRNLSGEEVKKLIKIFQTRSKLRKVVTTQPPVQNVIASNIVAQAAASSSSSASASSSVLPAAAVTSASTSRRNSIDSTASEEDRKKGGSKSAAGARGVTKIQQTCKRWLADECTHTEETCKYLHVPSICRAFQRGTCPKGQSCPFVHDKQDREHYRHGRSFCQKTAVHADAPAPAAKASSTSSSTAAKAAPPKDSLDNILSGLGSWKIAPKKHEPEPAAEEEPEESMPEVAEEDQPLETGMDGDLGIGGVGGVGGVVDAAEQDALEAAQEFEADQQASASAASVFDQDDGAATFSQQGFLDNGLSFDLPNSLSAGVVGSSVGGAPWSVQHATFDEGSFVPDEDGGMFFPPPGAASFGQAGASQQQAQQPQVEAEFPWFLQFRSAIVQPALQQVHAREQREQQKIVGPD